MAEKYEALKAEHDVCTKRVKAVLAHIEKEKSTYFQTLPIVQEHLTEAKSGKKEGKEAETKDGKEGEGKKLKSNEVVMHTVTHLLQYCVLPRMLLSQEDAIYCARFVHLLHEKSTPGFSSLQVLDRIVKFAVPTVFCTTEREVRALPLFVRL